MSLLLRDDMTGINTPNQTMEIYINESSCSEDWKAMSRKLDRYANALPKHSVAYFSFKCPKVSCMYITGCHIE
jgi:hypothetical protein